MEGVWESASANMETYLMLAEKAKAFRADAGTTELMTKAGIFELAEPTLSSGETIQDFLCED